MSIVLRVLGNNFLTRGLGSVDSTPPSVSQCEEINLNISSNVSWDKLHYPVTGTFANVSGWKWNKSIPQRKNDQKARIEGMLGGHESNLEEGSISNDWFGGALHGIKVNGFWEKQGLTKRKVWIPKVETGIYSIFNLSKKLYSNGSSCKVLDILNTETVDSVEYKTYQLPDSALENSVNVYLFKRDTRFNNIPYKTFEYKSIPSENFQFNIKENKLYFISAFKKIIGTNSNEIDIIHCFDELLGIGNNRRRIFYTEYFPAINPIVKTIQGSTVHVWTKVDSFKNSASSDRHYIFDSETGKVILSKYDKHLYYMKSYDASKKFLETFYEVKGVPREGKLFVGNSEITYREIGKYGFYLENEFNNFVEGETVSAIGHGKKLGSGEQVFISYEHVPRVDFEVKEEHFYNKDLNVKPYTKIESNGILEIGVDEKHLSRIDLTCDKEEIIENVFQTLYIQQDSTLLTAKAFNSNDKPVEEQDITFYAEEGAFEGDSINSITRVTNSVGEAHTVFTYPYQDNNLCSVSHAYHVAGSTYLNVDRLPTGITANDVSVFQILKTDSYYGSLGIKLNASSIGAHNNSFYKITIEDAVLDIEDYQSNQLDLATNDPDRIIREELLEDGTARKNAYNFAVCLIEFDDSTVSEKAAIKQIVGNSVYIYNSSNIQRAVASRTINAIRLFKKDELIFEKPFLTKDTRGVNRILYKYSVVNERYERLKPTRVEGNKIWFDNMLLPESSMVDDSILTAGYKIIMPRNVSLYATGIDPATGITVRSNSISIKVDFPPYLKSDLGFKFKEANDEESSGLGGANFISINPDFANNQINFFVEN